MVGYEIGSAVLFTRFDTLWHYFWLLPEIGHQFADYQHPKYQTTGKFHKCFIQDVSNSGLPQRNKKKQPQFQIGRNMVHWNYFWNNSFIWTYANTKGSSVCQILSNLREALEGIDQFRRDFMLEPHFVRYNGGICFGHRTTLKK